MGNLKKKNQPQQSPAPVVKQDNKKAGKKELIIFTEVSDEELQRRRVPVYPYIM